MTTSISYDRQPKLANAATRAFAAIAFLFVLGTLIPARVMGASDSWNVDIATPSWITAANWWGNQVPGIAGGNNSTDIATFSKAQAANRVVTVDTLRNIGGITFGNPSAYKFTLGTTAQTLNLSNGGVVQTVPGIGVHVDTIVMAIQIQGDGGSVTFTSGALTGTGYLLIGAGAITGVSGAGNNTTITLNGANKDDNAVTGVIGLASGGGKLRVIKDGVGTWRLGGANTFLGTVQVLNGVLKVGVAAGMGAGSGTGGEGTTVADGATLEVNATVANTEQIEIRGAGYESLGALASTGTGLLPTGSTITMNASSSMGGAGSLTVNGPIVEAGAGGYVLTKVGVGTLTLGNTGNAYSGGTVINGGAISVSADGNLGNTAGDLTFNGDAKLINTAATLTLGTGRSIVINALSTAIFNTGASPNVLTLDGNISGAGGLLKNDTGTLKLTGSNTYAGGTKVAAGTLQLVNGNAIKDTAQIIIAGGKVRLDNNETVGSLVFNNQLQPVGTYGSTASTADNKNDTYFDVDGAGVLTVTDGPASASSTFFVNQNATSGKSNGSTWANAYLTLQDALLASGSGVSILVKGGGTYKPANQFANFTVPTGVSLYGGLTGNEATLPVAWNTVLNPTTISGDLDNSGGMGNVGDCYQLVLLAAPGAQTINGFTIRSSYSPVNAGGPIAAAGTAGGGLQVGTTGAAALNVLVKNCIFKFHYGRYGAAISSPTSANTSTPVIENCVFTLNSGSAFNSVAAYIRGAVGTTFRHCTFAGNDAGTADGSFQGRGGTLAIQNCILWDAGSPTWPGGFKKNSPSVTAYNCNVEGTWSIANQGASYVDGVSGVVMTPADPKFQDLANGICRLNSDSPCKTGGDNAYKTTYDIQGKARPAGATCSLGAYEYLPQRTCTATAGAGGTIAMIPAGGVVVDGDTATFTASYDPVNFEIDYWTDNGSTVTPNPGDVYTIPGIDGNHDVVVIFKAKGGNATVRVATDPAGAGLDYSVFLADGVTHETSGSPAPATSPYTGAPGYKEFSWANNSSHVLEIVNTVQIRSGTYGPTRYTFDTWATPNDNEPIYNYTVPGSGTGPFVETANFNAEYGLSVSASPGVGGSVDPAGVTYPASSPLNVEATASSGYSFTGWTVDSASAGTANPLSVTMNAPHTVVANFVRVWFVKETGTGNGTSWANACSLLYAVQNVASGERIYIAGGTYTALSSGYFDIVASGARGDGGVGVYGGFAGTEATLAERTDPTANPTVLDGNGYAHTMQIGGSDFIIDGIRFTGQRGTFNAGATGYGALCTAYTGNNLVNGRDGTVRNCIFDDNDYAINFNSAFDGQPRYVENCIFKDNHDTTIYWYRAIGGHIYNCTFYNNAASSLRRGGGSTYGSMTACILNDQGKTFDSVTSWTIDYCYVTPSETGTGGNCTVGTTPGFLGAPGDLRLAAPPGPCHDFSARLTDSDIRGKVRTDPADVGAYEYTGYFTADVAATPVLTPPNGLTVTVDGNTQETPHQFSGDLTMSLAATTPQIYGTTRYTFTRWNDGAGLTPTANPYSYTITGNKNWTAEFGTEYQCSYIVSPVGAATVTMNPLSGWVTSGNNLEVTLSGILAGYSLSDWLLNGVSQGASDNPHTFTGIAGPATVTAVFVCSGSTIAVGTSPDGRTYTADGDGPRTGDKSYCWVAGSGKTLATTDNQDVGDTQYRFVNWDDGLGWSSGLLSASYTVPGADATVRANFNTYHKLTVTAPSGGSFGYSPSLPGDTYYQDGTPVTVTATASAGYVLSGWSGTATVGATYPSANEITFAMDAAETLAATFTPRCLVDKDSVAGTPDGLTWATAYPTLHAALAAAGAGTEFWVAEGSYSPAGATTTMDVQNGDQIYGGFGGIGVNETARSSRNPVIHQTIVTGDWLGDASSDMTTAPLFTVASGGTGTFDGFTFEKANNTTAAGTSSKFGGVFGSVGGTTGGYVARHCIFRNNSAASGAVAGLNYGSSRFENCLMVNNTSTEVYGSIYARRGSLAMVNCTMADNIGPAATAGTDIRADNSSGTFGADNCIFRSGDVGVSSVNITAGTSPMTMNNIKGLATITPARYSGSGNADAVPGFVAAGAYQLGAGSLMLDAGTVVTLNDSLDLAGNARIVGGSIDIGAYEGFVYALTYNAGTGGSIVGTTPQYVLPGGDGTMVTATALGGYHFVSWDVAPATPAARTETAVAANITASASFAANPALTVTVNQAGTDPTSSSPINFTVMFSQAVSDFLDGDVTLGGTAGATTAVVTGSGTTYNVAVSGMSVSGTVVVSIDAGKVADDAYGTANQASTGDGTVQYNVPSALPDTTILMFN